jgi:hypothetical protein
LGASFPGGAGMNRQRWLLASLAAIVFVAAGAWAFPRLFKPVTTEVPLPPTGEAAYNPLYALKLSLQQQRRPVSAWPSLAAAQHALGTRDTLFVYERPEAIGEQQAQRLLAWVRAGGHLLVPGPASSGDPGRLAQLLGLRAVAVPEEKPSKAAVDEAETEDENEDEDAPFECERLLDAGAAVDAKAKASVWLCDPRFVATVPGYAFGGGDARRGYRFARRQLGAGQVTVAELRYFDNEGLRRPPVRELAAAYLAPALAPGRVHLVYSADVPSLLRLLLTHAWMVLLPLALALAAWLAWRGQRFGPLQPLPTPRRRALFEHVHAAGEFAWGRGRAGALHAAVLRLFQQRLRLRDPWTAALDGEAQVLALAESLSLPAPRVRQALHPQGLQHPATFTQAIATLLQMRNRL